MRLGEIKHLYETNKALEDLGIRRITRNDIAPTVKHVSELTGIPEDQLHLLGSGGKIS